MKLSEKTIETLLSLKTPAAIAVSGFGGAGKSTLTKLLSSTLDAPIVCIDSFINNQKSTTYDNWKIMDYDRLIEEVLQPFKEGKNPIIYEHSRWDVVDFDPKIELTHHGNIIVEGVGILQPNLMKFFDYSFWINCPVEVASSRGKKRDKEVYKKPQDAKWDGLWKENDMHFFEKFRPDKLASEIINNE